jgi:hypothetical protein
MCAIPGQPDLFKDFDLPRTPHLSGISSNLENEGFVEQ